MIVGLRSRLARVSSKSSRPHETCAHFLERPGGRAGAQERTRSDARLLAGTLDRQLLQGGACHLIPHIALPGNGLFGDRAVFPGSVWGMAEKQRLQGLQEGDDGPQARGLWLMTHLAS